LDLDEHKAPLLTGLVSDEDVRREIFRLRRLCPGVDFSRQAVDRRRHFLSRVERQIDGIDATKSKWVRQRHDALAIAPLDRALRLLYDELDANESIRALATGVPKKRRLEASEDPANEDVGHDGLASPPRYDEDVPASPPCYDEDVPASPPSSDEAAPAAVSPSLELADSLQSASISADLPSPPGRVFFRCPDSRTRVRTFTAESALTDFDLGFGDDVFYTYGGRVLDSSVPLSGQVQVSEPTIEVNPRLRGGGGVKSRGRGGVKSRRFKSTVEHRQTKIQEIPAGLEASEVEPFRVYRDNVDDSVTVEKFRDVWVICPRYLSEARFAKFLFEETEADTMDAIPPIIRGNVDWDGVWSLGLCLDYDEFDGYYYSH